MTPSERDMPVVEVVGPYPDHRYAVTLPGGIRVERRSRAAIEEVVAKNCPYTAIRYVNPR